MKRIMFLESIAYDQQKKYTLCIKIRTQVITITLHAYRGSGIIQKSEGQSHGNPSVHIISNRFRDRHLF
jgi:hypothetical protein